MSGLLDMTTYKEKNGTAEKKIDKFDDTQNLVFSIDDAINKVGFGKFQIRLTIFSGFAWMGDAFEIFILSVIGNFMACDWQLYRWQIALLTSVVFAGIMLGSPVLGTVADIYGRKKCLALAVTFIFIFGAVSAASPSYLWMVIFRTFLGFFLGGIAQSMTLNSEYCPIHMRGKATFYMCYFWSLGSIGVILMSWVVMEYLNSWRILLLGVSLPSLVVILQLKWYPESARYFLVSNQYDRANRILEKMAVSNGKELPPGKLMKISTETKRGRMKDLLGKRYRRTSLIFWYIWFASAFGYYGIVLLSPNFIQEGNLTTKNHSITFMEDMQNVVPCVPFSQKDYVNLLWTSAAEFPGLLVFTFLIERVSRKKLHSASLVISSILVFLLLLRTHKIVVLLFLFGVRGLLCCIMQLNYIISSEAYPTTVRAIGIGTGVGFCRLGGLIVPYVAQVLVIENPVAAMCLLGGVLFLAGIAAAFLPFETRGAQMKESHSPSSGNGDN